MKSAFVAGFATLGLLGGVGAAPASAQQVDARLTANYGEISLRTGFEPDPYAVLVRAGGSLDAETVAQGCVGSISPAPDLQVTFVAGDLPLSFGTISERDTSVVINGPDGNWYCDDDSGGDRDALFTFRNPQSGVYDIWVGSYEGGNAPAQLFITERVP